MKFHMHDIERKIDLALPDEKVIADLRGIIAECTGPIEVGERNVVVPPDIQHEIVAKSFHGYRCDVGFTAFRVLVAVGGLECVEFGIPTARLCFALLHYDEKGDLVTQDFSAEMP